MRSATVLVVGGSGGIGAAICRRLARDWARVIVGYHRNAAAADAVVADLPHAAALPIDLRDGDEIAAVVDGIDRLGGVVMAGGIAIPQPAVADTRPDQWREVIEAELLGFASLVAAVLPVFRARGGGSLVAVTSFANTHFPPGDALSSVPKAGIEALCRAVAKEEGRNGIRANCVGPGMVNAGLGARYQRELFDHATWDRVRRRVPLGRFVEAEEVAAAAAFLLSEDARSITGQTLILDGGQSL